MAFIKVVHNFCCAVVSSCRMPPRKRAQKPPPSRGRPAHGNKRTVQEPEAVEEPAHQNKLVRLEALTEQMTEAVTASVKDHIKMAVQQQLAELLAQQDSGPSIGAIGTHRLTTPQQMRSAPSTWTPQNQSGGLPLTAQGLGPCSVGGSDACISTESGLGPDSEESGIAAQVGRMVQAIRGREDLQRPTYTETDQVPRLGLGPDTQNNNLAVVNNSGRIFECGRGELAPGSVLLPLDYAVPLSLKKRIWADEFIDFVTLLNPSQHSQMTMAVQKDEAGDSSLCLVQGEKKAPKTIKEWTSAFNIFMAVYTQKNPEQVAAMLKYGEDVREIADEGGNFNYYDITFRKLRQTNLSPWNAWHSQLYVKAIKMGGHLKTQSRGQDDDKTRSQFPRSFCFKYHGNQPCDGFCGFKHSCFRCQGNHPIFRCSKRNNESGSFQEPQGQGFPAYRGQGQRESQGRGYHDQYHWRPQRENASYQFGGPNQRYNTNPNKDRNSSRPT